MARKQFYDFEGADVVVRFEPARCIHAEECVHGLPGVFDPERRPWIDSDRAPADEIAEVVDRCPTGALSFERRDGGSPEAAPARNRVGLKPDGPAYLRGDLRLRMPSGEVREETRIALCRCGRSQNKPFCDNGHREGGFTDEGSLGEAKLAPAETAKGGGGTVEAGPLELALAPNGPVLLRGPVEVESADAEQRQAGVKGALCRCGESRNRPYCDGSHAAAGFEAD